MRLKSARLFYEFRTVRYIFDLWTDNLSVDMIVSFFPSFLEVCGLIIVVIMFLRTSACGKSMM